MEALPIIDYASHPAYQDLPKAKDGLQQRVLETFGALVEEKRQALAAFGDAFQARAAASPDSTIDALARGGVAPVRLPPAALARLRSLFAPVDAALKARIESIRTEGRPLKFPDTEAPVQVNGEPAPGMADLAAAVLEIIQASGAVDVAEGYYQGYSGKPWNIVFRRNVADQDFFRAKGMQTSRTAGMHIDSNSRPALNGVLYLNEVGPGQGPFKYVAGSNHWRFDPEDRAIRKAVDEAGYGSGSARKFFIQLPPEHRRKASFGYDVLDGEPLSQALLSRERMYASDVADMVLFDSDGVHRGGDVAQGHRASILFSVKITPKKSRAR